jgi:hypothetical protein
MDSDPSRYIIEVLARRTGLSPDQIRLDARLLQDLRLDGDDAVDAILEISKGCSMDLSECDLSLYFRSEPSLFSFLWFLPSQKQNRIEKKRPLTVRELIEAARIGRLRNGPI